MRLFWRFNSDDGTPTASSTANGYDVVNLQRSALLPGWKSEAVLNEEELVVDLGSPQSISAFALLGHNLATTAELSTVTLEYANDVGFTVAPGSITVSVTDDNWYQFFGVQTRQFWRVTIPKLGGVVTHQPAAGRLVLGEQFSPTYALRPGYQLGGGSTNTATISTRGGQLYSSLGETFRVLSGTMPGLSDADFDEIETLKKTYSTGVPFIVALDWETDPTRSTVYGVQTSTTPMMNVAIDKWEWPLRIVEVK